MKKTYKENLLASVIEKGYIFISKKDSFVWKKRKILNELVIEGKLKIYDVSPSYDGYKPV